MKGADHGHSNEFGQAIGTPLSEWKPPGFPPRSTLQGNLVNLEPLDPQKHSEGLFWGLQADPRSWTYLPYGPFADIEEFSEWLQKECCGEDPLFYVLVRKSDSKPVGLASYLRMFPEQGSLEVGHIHFSSEIRRSPISTEVMFLMMENAFGLGYRRYEWKCDALNVASRSAAQRLGFSFEGVFRQATVYKNRNRDTAWYAVIDSDWPKLRDAFQTWLSSSNFDEDGEQRISLSELTEPLLVQRG